MPESMEELDVTIASLPANQWKSGWRLAPRELGRRLRRLRQWLADRTDYLAYGKALDEQALSEHPDVQFTPACRSDLPALSAELRYRGWRMRSRLAEQLRPDEHTLIGRDRRTGEVVYTAWVSQSDPTMRLMGPACEGAWSIRRIWVRPDRRRQGIARCGQGLAEQVARARGADCLWAFVRVDNDRSRRLHEGFGYAPRAVLRVDTLLGWRRVGVQWTPSSQPGLDQTVSQSPD